MGPGSGPGRGSSLSIDGAEAMGLGPVLLFSGMGGLPASLFQYRAHIVGCPGSANSREKDSLEFRKPGPTRQELKDFWISLDGLRRFLQTAGLLFCVHRASLGYLSSSF